MRVPPRRGESIVDALAVTGPWSAVPPNNAAAEWIASLRDITKLLDVSPVLIVDLFGPDLTLAPVSPRTLVFTIIL